ncbi:MAG: PC4/YdbC family ssDNA-binding protein [Candidatus Metalachnospira sp.]|nr:PC4/YdbC family ssDNA-binding protein [Candidatus Metalachnospira sp.]
MEFKILKAYGVIGESRGTTKELNLVKWGNGEPKFDIREWPEEHDKPFKGIALTSDQLLSLRTAIDKALKDGGSSEELG